MTVAQRARRFQPNTNRAGVERQVKAIDEGNRLFHVHAKFLGADHDWAAISVGLDQFEEHLGEGHPHDERAIRAVRAMLPKDVVLVSDPEGTAWLLTDDRLAAAVMAMEDAPIEGATVRDWLGGIDSVFSPRRTDIDLDDAGRLHWSDLEPARTPADKEDILLHPEGYLYLPRELAFGDYDNSSAVERSNYRVFIEQYGEVKDAFGEQGIYEVVGDHGANAIAIRLTVADEGVLETLSALSDYPLIDEEDMSNLETEMADEAWEDYGRNELVDELEKKFDITIDDHDQTGLNEVRYAAEQEAGIYPEIEGGGGVVFHFKRLLKEIDIDDLDAAGVKYTPNADD